MRFGPASSDNRTHDPAADLFGPAFAIDEPVSVVSPAVFASPHSGRLYPKAFLADAACSLIELRRIEDAYVDRLLAEVPDTGAPVISGLIGRACLDLNRGEAEIDPAMFHDPSPVWRQNRSPRVEAGLGALPRIASNGTSIYRGKLWRAEAEARLAHIYRPYHRALSGLLRRSQAMFGQAWLIDCHSMPADAETSGRTPDVVIGDRFGASCGSDLAARVERLFQQKGYQTARNAPYAGGFATLSYGQPAEGRHALQIEVRRRLYLDEDRVEPNDGFLALRRDFTAIATEICTWTRAEVGLGVGNTRRSVSA
jgi:N-formylglutamate amidohydrolase